jgi:hypothetical protein
MGIEFTHTTACLTGVVGVEDAETLLEWLRSHPDGSVDLSGCSHLNAANLQVLMAGKPKIGAWPVDEMLSTWLRNAIFPE